MKMKEKRAAETPTTQRRWGPMAGFLFFIFSLHTMVFGLIQWPDSFLYAEFQQANSNLLKLLFYLSALVVGCLHQPIARAIGLKKPLIWGLFSTAIGFFCILLYHLFSHEHGLLEVLPFFTVIFLGVAFLSVINCLVTFITLVYPKKTILAIIVLFMFGNLGLMLAPFLLSFAAGKTEELTLFVIVLLLIFSWLVHYLFTEPEYPLHMEHLRSGTLIWVEMHRRLFLYVLAIILFGVIESSFSIWGGAYAKIASVTEEEVGFTYWIASTLGQLMLLIPLIFFEPRRVFYVLACILAAALLFLPFQSQGINILVGLAAGGLGASAMFPIMLAFLEMEVIHVALAGRHVHYLPLIETAISFMVAGYVLGVGIVDFWASLLPPGPIKKEFFIAFFLLAWMVAIIAYLNFTRGSMRSRKS
jgi:hypothetical protein